MWRAQEGAIKAGGPWETPEAEAITQRLASAGALELADGSYHVVEPHDYEVSLRSIEGDPSGSSILKGEPSGTSTSSTYTASATKGLCTRTRAAPTGSDGYEERREVSVGRAEEWLTETRPTLLPQVLERREFSRREVGPDTFRWVARLARVEVSERYEEYSEFRRRDHHLLDTRPIDPVLERTRPTVSLILDLPAQVDDTAGHAIEHALQAMMPTEVMCDRRDFVGLTHHGPTIFLYDRNLDGLGFAERAFERLPAILAAAADRVARCRCDYGCPLCIQSSSCERWNDSLAKEEASRALDAVLGIARDRQVTPAKARRQASGGGVRGIARSVADAMVEEQQAASLATVSHRLADTEALSSDQGWATAQYQAGLAVRHAAFGSGRVIVAKAGKYGPEVQWSSTGGRRTIIGGVGNFIVGYEAR